MAENPVFNTDYILGDGLSKLSRAKLVALAVDICSIAYKESGEGGYRGGIRPENISIGPDSEVAVGPAGVFDKDDCTKEELEYISPELFWSGKAGSRADVYSIGLLLYAGISEGRLPFVTDGSDPDSADAFRKRMNGDKIKAPAGIGKKLGAIIEQATEFSAVSRFENTLELASELKSLLVKPDTDIVAKAAMEAFGKPEEDLSDIERMMLDIVTSSALRDELANVPIEEPELIDDEPEEEDIEVEIEELPYEPEEPEEESIEVEIEELPPEPEEPEEKSIVVEIEELPPAASELDEEIHELFHENDGKLEFNGVAPLEDPVIDKMVEELKTEEPEKAEEPEADDEPVEVPEFVNAAKPEPAPKAEKASKRPKVSIVIIALCAVLAIAAIIYNKQENKNVDGTNRVLPPIEYVTPEPTESAVPEETAEPTETPEPTPSEEPEKVTTYQVFVENISWDQAEQKCVELGGHLVTIRNEDEYNKVCEQLNATNAKYAWVGCYRNSAGVLTWTSGDNVDYYVWAANEPSYKDSYDGTYEDYIMLVRQPDGSWKYNDSRINPVAKYAQFYSGLIAYVCETIE